MYLIERGLPLSLSGSNRKIVPPPKKKLWPEHIIIIIIIIITTTTTTDVKNEWGYTCPIVSVNGLPWDNFTFIFLYITYSFAYSQQVGLLQISIFDTRISASVFWTRWCIGQYL